MEAESLLQNPKARVQNAKTQRRKEESTHGNTSLFERTRGPLQRREAGAFPAGAPFEVCRRLNRSVLHCVGKACVLAEERFPRSSGNSATRQL